ncbi:MAG: hypothetical protein JSV24_05635 [Bacteroidales bacterium]|nr:MAG: hypothetical protein JSV24_05635 [Bacteroidales bacterium]
MVQRALFAGITTIDIQYFVENYPVPDTKTKSSSFLFSTGGPATNAAATFSFLGGESHLCSVVGKNHYFSEFIYNDLKKWNIVLKDLMPESAEIPTISSIITAADTGERTIVYTRRSHNILPSGLVEQFSGYSYDIILVDGMNMEACTEFARYGQSEGIPVVLDGGSWKEGMEKLLPFITIAICSDDFNPPGTNNIREVMDFLEYQDIELIVVTRGKNPVLFLENGRKEEIKIAPVKVVDTLGAGDVFHGSFCYHYIQNMDFREALNKAAETATESCKFRGARTWMIDEKRDE